MGCQRTGCRLVADVVGGLTNVVLYVAREKNVGL